MEIARRVVECLQKGRQRVVLAESCTAGLAAATLGAIPGVSNWLCGSAVTYREQTKIDWLHVEPAALEASTAVSEPVASQMAIGVLQVTAEADWAAAITGHLGPDAPAELDGVLYIAIARRIGDSRQIVRRRHDRLPATDRLTRRDLAVELLLTELCHGLEQDLAMSDLPDAGRSSR